jgi:adenosylmethionine-8-amino-7-oxononanoate aminotransferase
MGKNRVDCDIECVNGMEKILREKHGEIAAVILEPMVMAAGGMIVYPAEYLKRTAALAKKYDVHLILDEVATGFGRTGRMFASEHAGVKPDLMCLSKGIASGTLPLGVTLATRKIFDAFYGDYEKKKTLYHGHTYTGNPISCAAALASLSLFKSEGTLERVRRISPILHSRLEDFRRLPLVGDVRYIGMIGAIELVRGKDTKAAFDFKERVGLRIYKEGLKEGIILRPLGSIIYLYLPLCLSESETSLILEKVFRAIKRII